MLSTTTAPAILLEQLRSNPGLTTLFTTADWAARAKP
jgi:hypothetical protein